MSPGGSMTMLSARLQDRAYLLEHITHVLLFVFVIFSVISISIMQAAYILAIAAWIARVYVQGSYRQLRFPLILPLGSFVLASLVATITGVIPAKSLSEFRNVFAASLFFLVVNEVATEERATALIKVLIATGTAMALYGLLQAVSHEMSVRIYGTMSIYMTFAGLLMLVNLMALAQVLYQTEGRQADLVPGGLSLYDCCTVDDGNAQRLARVYCRRLCGTRATEKNVAPFFAAHYAADLFPCSPRGARAHAEYGGPEAYHRSGTSLNVA